MKRFSLFLYLLFPFFSLSQITVTSNNLVEIGDIINGTIIENNVPDPGNGGANQLWDFSNLSGTPISNEYMSPQSTPYSNLELTTSSNCPSDPNDILCLPWVENIINLALQDPDCNVSLSLGTLNSSSVIVVDEGCGSGGLFAAFQTIFDCDGNIIDECSGFPGLI
ncbi:MAG: hypothetical protein AAF573_09645, partial [Bacteroidota bacterium]